MKRKAILAGLLTALLASLSWQPYQLPPIDRLRQKAHYLERIIRTPQGEGSELTALGQQNFEWALFTLSFSVFAFTNLAARDSSFQPEAARYTELAIQKALTDSIAGPFGRDGAAPAADSAGSILYLGHLNLMLGCHRRLNPATAYAPLHDSLSRVLHRRFLQAPGYCLESYPGMVWVPDNTVALASLQLHSDLTCSPYNSFCRRWVHYARQHLTDPGSGLLLSRPATAHQPAEGPRGSMLGWSILFLYRFAPDFAAEQYQRFREQASTNLGLLRLYRERPGSYATTGGDMDSGPLVLGYSIPANAFAFGNAVALHDWRNARRLRRVISIGSREITGNDELRYGVRFADLSVSPMAEALLLHAETMTPWHL